SFRYYIWQLGYATFPWVGLAPMAAVRWLRRDGVPRDPDRERRFTGEVLLGAWLLVGFALFSVMGTKFHHYGAPLVPPLAMLSGIFLAERWRDRDGSDEALFGGASLVVAAVVVLAVGRDLAWRAPGRLSEARLFHLVTYAYDRPWPTGLDHHLALWLFTGAAALALGAMIALRLRRRAAMLVLAVSLGFGAWLLDVYLPALSPHYGQRELFLRYEREQARDPGPIIAYQMNWKGENFYRGNEVVAFVSTGRLFQDHVASLRTSGVRTMYFVTQPKRLDSLRAEIGVVPESLSTPEENNKFLLLRVHFPP
ncbi:MAG: glycosyltransferase family 39 protein, partial [Myxococcales bacterium]|nr:glycosyltransferase family 39 protein [Myxococcales bacterium]